MMKLLVIVADYPSNEGINLMYVHTRNLYYKKLGIDITVLNFKVNEGYMYEDIKVISLKEFHNLKESFDILICHAPNIRNHYIFLKKYENKFKKIVFFFHGHEVLYINKVYSKPFFYLKQNKIEKLFRNLYDIFKLRLWRNYLPQITDKSHFIFVSNWMLEEFKKWIKLSEKDLKNQISVTYNSVGEFFEKEDYKNENKKEFDFITIRGNLDGSKYCVDIICELAKKYPKYKFLLIGKGKFFKYNKKPENLKWENRTCDQKEIIELLNKGRCALMPTRTDAQGLMACEMATYGIPLITSDISVCHEVFKDFNNVVFIKNENPTENFENLYEKLLNSYVFKKNEKYYAKKTVQYEIEIFKKILKKGER